ncbi:solute carrier family 22 member 5 isoform X2 [Nilaparvata lugens]|uniref:solute carrier family 22 member 5 isoform X2 n=1 Tax=Nilaparvata lugens TaxID=108931 RepID=UPI00193D70DC|nr:solute carrier family 22 member 5 isoform X2 [Nilaparvata lugens]
MDRDAAAIEAALEKVGSKSSCWLWGVFILTSMPGAFNSMNMMTYVFFTHVPPYWCKVDELTSAGWTHAQIRNVSSPDASDNSCFRYDWDYAQLAGLGYNGSLDFISKAEQKPKLIECQTFEYEESTPKSTIVSEWNLVCHRDHLRSFTQVTIAFGKFFGGFVFGAISDKYGRKTSFILATVLYIVAGPLAALVPSFTVFNITRFIVGMAGSGVYETTFTILTEIAVRVYRTLFGCVFNISYPVGYILLPVLAYVSHDWRQLQLYVSLSILVLVMHFCLLPESPRWLLSKGKNAAAWKVLEKSGGVDRDARNRQENRPAPAPPNQGQAARKSCCKRLLHSLEEILSLFGSVEICKRIFICYFAWFAASITYYAIDFPIAILIMALTGRFCISAVFAVIILQTSELFPTVNRNSAIGTSLTVAQLGAVAAPYVVNFMGGKKYWFLPSTFCGILSILTAILIASLPETKDKPMANTVEDIKNQPDKVSFLSFFKFVCFCW